MASRNVSALLSAVLVLVALLATESRAAAPDGISLRDFIDQYAKQEGKDVVVDPRLKGVVEISSGMTPDRISKEEFHGALLATNWAAYEEDGVIRIVQAVLIKQQKIPYYDGVDRNGLASTQVVSSTIHLERRPAYDLVDHLRPLVEQWGYVAADDRANALIVVTTVANVERLVELVGKLDR